VEEHATVAVRDELVLAEAQAQPGVFRFRGRMVDEPVLRQARRIATM